VIIMAKDALAKFAIDKARGIVGRDGDLQLIDVRDNVAYVRFLAQRNDECASCSIGPDDLKHFLIDIFQSVAPHIKGFDIDFKEVSA
jgi:hypothetical protein